MGVLFQRGLEQPPLDSPLERFLAAGFKVTQGQEQRVLLRAFRRLCAVRKGIAVGIRQAQPPHGYPVRYRLHPCSATEHSHRRAALKPFVPAIRTAVYAQVSTPTIYIENPAVPMATVRREPRKRLSETMLQICAALPERQGCALVAANFPLTLSRVKSIPLPP